MIDYLSNQSNHCKTYETLVNMGFSGDCFRVRFSHPLLSKSARKPCIYWLSSTFVFCHSRACLKKALEQLPQWPDNNPEHTVI